MIMGVATRGKVPEWKRLGYKSEAEFNADTDTDTDFVGLLDDWDDDIDDRSDEDID